VNEEREFGSLLDALLAHGIEFRRNLSDPNEISLCCPYCYEKKFRLGLNVQKNVAHCFKCEWRSRKAVEELSEALDLGVFSAGNFDAQNRGEEGGSGTAAPSLPDDFTLLVNPPPGVLYKQAHNYLLGRGVKEWQIQQKKIGVSFCGDYAYRVVFPVYYGRELQGLVTRDFTGKQEPKYKNSPGMKAVYNSPQTKKNKAVLCEGIFDCLALERVVPTINYDVLALLGHGLTERQEERLADYRDIILWPDADIPGVKGFLDLAAQLALRHRVYIVPPCESAKDAGEMKSSDLAYAWATRTKLTSSLELRLRAEAAFRE
jgi:hypothetical protein